MKQELRYAAVNAEEVKVVNELKGEVEAIITVEVEDRDGDIVRVGDGKETGLLLGQFRKNPLVLWQHGYDSRGMKPIAQAVSLEPTTFKRKPAMSAVAKFSLDDPEDSEPRVLFRMVLNKLLRAWSIRFFPFKDDMEERDSSQGWMGYDFKKSELREFSLVAIPANALALTQAVKDGICDVPWLMEHGVVKAAEYQFGKPTLVDMKRTSVTFLGADGEVIQKVAADWSDIEQFKTAAKAETERLVDIAIKERMAGIEARLRAMEPEPDALFRLLQAAAEAEKSE